MWRVVRPASGLSDMVNLSRAKDAAWGLAETAIARMLRQRQLLMTTPKQRSKIARKAAKARWSKPIEEIKA
jgi:hypothetical protein